VEHPSCPGCSREELTPIWTVPGQHHGLNSLPVLSGAPVASDSLLACLGVSVCHDSPSLQLSPWYTTKYFSKEKILNVWPDVQVDKVLKAFA
jgi:hypothetical protein